MLTMVDNAVIVLATVGVLAIGYYFSKSVTSMESYYLANRSLPWSLVVGTLMASWYGGVGVIGTVGYASTFGLASWFLWSIGAHAVRFPLALWVGPRIHIRSDVTMPDVLHNTYGKAVAIIGAIFMFVYCSQVGEITATGVIGEASWGINKVLLGTIIVIITIALTILGGLMGVAVTDMIFFMFMVLSVSLVFPSIFTDVGGIAGIRAATAARPEFMHPVGGMSVSKAMMLIILCINVYSDPTFYQRFSASNSPKTGRRALLTCLSLWMAFDIVTMVAGFAAGILHPDQAPEFAYIQMVLSRLPQGLRALFIIGLFGAIISTLDSYYLVGGTALAKDIYGRLVTKTISDRTMLNMSRVGSVILGLMGLGLAFRFTMVYDAIAFMSSLSMSVLFCPLMMALMYKGRKTPMAGMLSMLVGCAGFALAKLYPIEIAGFGTLEPLLVGLPVSFISWIVGNSFGRDINEGKTSVVSGAEDASVRISWFGLDGLLCLLFVAVAYVIGSALINNDERMIGQIVPYGVAGVTTLIFLKYVFEVMSFASGVKKPGA